MIRLQKMRATSDQVCSISEVTKTVAMGGLSKLVDVHGKVLDLKMTVNSMVSQLSTLANEVTRVSLEVGTDILGGQAFVPDVQGMWKVRPWPIILFTIRLTSRVGAHGQCELDGDEPHEPDVIDHGCNQGHRKC